MRPEDIGAFQTQPVWVSRAGSEQTINGLPPAPYSDLSLSADDERLAMVIADQVTDIGSPIISQIWVAQLPDGPRTRLTDEEARARRPVFGPGDSTLVYLSEAREADFVDTEARRLASDGSRFGASGRVFGTDQGLVEFVPIPGTDTVLFRIGTPSSSQRPSNLAVGELSTGRWDSLFPTPFNEHAVDLSPDGRWIAYVTDSSGQYEVAVRPFPAADRLVIVSTDGGQSPVWSHDGRELFYIDGEGWLVAAAYETETEFRVTSRTRLFDTAPFVWYDPGWRVFDVASDDQRFLFMRSSGESEGQGVEFVMVHDFFAELPDLSRP